MHANDPVNRHMSEAVLSIESDASVKSMLNLFVSYPVHHLPVVKERTVVGMISSADLMKLEFFLPPPGPARETLLNDRFKVDHVMRSPVVTVSEHETVQRAAELMAKNGIHSLPVVNRDDHLIGIITTTDLMDSCLRSSESAPASATEHVNAVESQVATALASARDLVQRNEDPQGIAVALIHVQQRAAALELVVHAAKRYLNAGQDERLHAALQKTIERVDRLEQLSGHSAVLGLGAAD